MSLTKVIRDPPYYGVIRFATVVSHMVSNIKKNKVDTKTCHIVTYNESITYSHGVITRVRHKKTTLATNLSKVSRKKKCYISTTYKIVKIIALHFTIIRHYMYIRGTT